MLRNSSILITGGTGSFGNAFIPLTLAKYSPRKIIVLSRDEMKQWEMAKIFKDDEYVEMIFLYFINGKNFPVPNHEQQFLECKSIKKEFFKNKIVYFLNNKNKKEILKNVIKKNNFSSETKEISDEKLNYLINKYNSCKQIINNECLDKHELCQQRKRILFYFTEDQRYSE